MTKDKSILINNIYHMLSYAFQTLKQENYDDVAVESFDEMYDLLAAILAKGIGYSVKTRVVSRVHKSSGRTPCNAWKDKYAWHYKESLVP